MLPSFLGLGAGRGCGHGGAGLADPLGERGRVDLPVVPELEEQAIAGRARELGRECHWFGAPARAGGWPRGMNVEIGEISLSKCDEVTARSQVGLHRDPPSIAEDRE